jgi:hypothetical protein
MRSPLPRALAARFAALAPLRISQLDRKPEFPIRVAGWRPRQSLVLCKRERSERSEAGGQVLVAWSERSEAVGCSCVVGGAGFLTSQLFEKLFQLGHDGLGTRELDVGIGGLSFVVADARFRVVF